MKNGKKSIMEDVGIHPILLLFSFSTIFFLVSEIDQRKRLKIGRVFRVKSYRRLLSRLYFILLRVRRNMTSFIRTFISRRRILEFLKRLKNLSVIIHIVKSRKMSQRKKNSDKSDRPGPPKSPPPAKLCSASKADSKEKKDDRNSKTNKPSSSDAPGKSKEVDKETKEDTVSETPESTMSKILNEDEKLLFSLQVVGSLQKNEKLTAKDGLPSIDDRYFQGLGRRWYTGDNRHKTSDGIFELSTNVLERVQALLDEDYTARLQEDKKKINVVGAETKETPEQKKFREECEDRRRTISRYFLSISKTKQEIENLRDTYDDKFTKEKLTLALSKVDETLEKLRKTQ
jgi:hypothetical protein